MGSAYAFPYLLGLLPKGIEVRTLTTQTLVQTLPLARAKFLTEGDATYVATASGLFRLIMLPLINQARTHTHTHTSIDRHTQ
jgi:Vam6/Vps39-like protein vacuolar protein sorting-associated protein 39